MTAKYFAIFGALFLLVSLRAPAQTSSLSVNTSTQKADKLKDSTEKVEDIDKEITDARMRAALGSKSLFSLKSSFSYHGGNIESPLSSVRPNYRSSKKLEDMSSLKGEVGLNTRIGSRDSIVVGTGIMVVDPLHGDITKPVTDPRKQNTSTISRYQISSPYISWNRGYRAWDIQMSTGLTYRHATEEDAVKLTKIYGSAFFSQNLLVDLGPKWGVGAGFMLGKVFYSGEVSDPYLVGMYSKGILKRTEMMASITPSLQYNFTDKYSFRTVFGYFQFSRYEGIDENVQTEPSQSVGMGISITRDIYVYPGIQFTPKDIRADRTNVHISANLNLF